MIQTGKELNILLPVFILTFLKMNQGFHITPRGMVSIRSKLQNKKEEE